MLFAVAVARRAEARVVTLAAMRRELAALRSVIALPPASPLSAVLPAAVSVPASTAIVVSPSLRQSQIAYSRIRSMHAVLGDAVPTMVEENALRFTLSNGAVVIALPSDARTIRGYTADLVVEDEAAFCLDSTFEAVVPMLATTNEGVVDLDEEAAS